MLTVKIQLPHRDKNGRVTFKVLTCDEVQPLYAHCGGHLLAVSCISFGANNVSGNTFERTIRMARTADREREADVVYVENSAGKTVNQYVSDEDTKE